MVFGFHVHLCGWSGNGRSWFCDAYIWRSVLVVSPLRYLSKCISDSSRTHYFASPKTRNALSFLVGYSNSLGLIGGLCSIDYGFSLMLLSVVVIATDGAFVITNGI